MDGITPHAVGSAVVRVVGESRELAVGGKGADRTTRGAAADLALAINSLDCIIDHAKGVVQFVVNSKYGVV